MKARILVTALIIVLIVIFSTFFMKPEILEEALEEISKITGGRVSETTTTTLPFTTGNKTPRGNETIVNQTNATGTGVSGGAVDESANKTTEAVKVVTLEIIDLCEGKMILESVSEGMRYCLNQKYPYHLVIEVNESNLTTWNYNYSELMQTYNLTSESTIYFLLVADVLSVTYEIEQFYMTTSLECLYLGNYTLHTVWEIDPTTGEMGITKMIAALPLNVDSSKIEKTEKWEEVKLYLKTLLKDYYLGNFFVEIK